MKTIFFPLRLQPICGHDRKPRMMGLEEGTMRVVGEKAIYVRSYMFGICEECEKRDLDQMKKEVEEYESKNLPTTSR